MNAMVNTLKAFFPAVIFAYVLASGLATQFNLAAIAALGMEVPLADRAWATFHDMVGMSSSYLILLLIAYTLSLPVAGWLSRKLSASRFLIFALAGFVALVALHLLMKAALGVSGIAATRTVLGLLSQGLAGALGGLAYVWLRNLDDAEPL